MIQVKFRHHENNYLIEGFLLNKTIKINLLSGGKKFSKTFFYGEFPDDVQKAYETIEEIFEILGEKKNILV